MYEAIAKMPDGKTLSVSGSIHDVAKWADEIITDNGSCEINIQRKDDSYES